MKKLWLMKIGTYHVSSFFYSRVTSKYFEVYICHCWRYFYNILKIKNDDNNKMPKILSKLLTSIFYGVVVGSSHASVTNLSLMRENGSIDRIRTRKKKIIINTTLLCCRYLKHDYWLFYMCYFLITCTTLKQKLFKFSTFPMSILSA